jgi:voltage-gated potassium channel
VKQDADPVPPATGECLPWRQRLYVHLEPTAWPKSGLSPLNRALVALIGAAALFAILESEPVIFQEWKGALSWIEHGFFAAFSLEYAVRLWAAGENPLYAGLFGRLRYMFSFPALLDLAALLPGLLSWMGSEGFVLRLFRLIRIFRVARLGRYSEALSAITEAVRSRRYGLMMSLSAAGIVLLLASTLLYVVEGAIQPEAFGSIPRAMWWAVATLTTVGYGDVTPVTVLGRLLAGLTAMTGIGLIAMPTGILAAAFSDVMQQKRNAAGETK